MLKRFGMCLCLVMFVGASICPAQEAPPGGDLAGRGTRSPRRERGMRDGRRLMQRMKTDMTLDPQQSEEIDKLVTEHNDAVRELRKTMRPEPSPEELEKMTEIREQMKAARESNDQAKIRELISQMRVGQEDREKAMEPLNAKLDEANKNLHEQILLKLKDDQKPKFEEIWTQELQGGPRAGRNRERYRGPERDPRAFKQLVEKQNLSTEQKQQVEDMFKQYFEAKQAASADPAAQELATKKLYDDVLNVLNPEQREKVEQQLKGRDRKPEVPGAGGTIPGLPGGDQPAEPQPEQPKGP